MGIRPDERTVLGLLVLIFGIAEAGRGLGVNASDALFFLRFGVDQLPRMYILLGGLTFLAMVIYAAGIARYGWKFIQALYLSVGLALILERLLIPTGQVLIYPSLWLTVQVCAWVLITSAWNLASEAFDTRQAKRLFSLLASASIAGSILGNAVTGPLANLIGTENLFLVYAGLLAAVYAATRRLVRTLPRTEAHQRTTRGPIDGLVLGFKTLTSSRLFRLIALSSVLFSVLYFSVWYPFNQSVTRNFSDEASLAGFLGNFTSVAMLSTLLLSLVSSRLYAHIGIVNVILVVPLIYLAGFGLWMIEFSLLTAIVFRFAQLVWINGAGWTAWNALFNVFHSGQRGLLRAFEAGVPSQLGTALSGVLLLMGQRGMSSDRITVLGGAAAAVCSVMCWRMRSAYGGSLLSAIRSGLVEVFTGTTSGLARFTTDSQARGSLLRALGDDDANVRRIATEVLGQLPAKEAGQDGLRAALKDPSPAVRFAAVNAARERGGMGSVPWLSPLLADQVPAVRQAAVRALGAIGPTGNGSWLEAPLQDRDAGVRAEAVAHLYRRGEHQAAVSRARSLLESGDREAAAAVLNTTRRGDLRLPLPDLLRYSRHPSGEIRSMVVESMKAFRSEDARKALLDALEDDDKRVRDAAAEVLRTRNLPAGTLLEKLTGTNPAVQLAAIQAMNLKEQGSREALVEWALSELDEAAALDGYAHGLERSISADSAPELEFLTDLVRRRQEERIDVLMRALARTFPGRTMDVIERGLKSGRRDLRSRALEALDTFTERDVRRRLMPILEASPHEDDLPSLERLLDQLSMNRDPWIRAIALRCMAAYRQAPAEELQSAVDEDSSQIVKKILGQEIGLKDIRMNETLDTLSTIERVMYLRKVPIFDDLSAEELHRIAQTAVEQLIPEGDYLCREGDREEQLYLIVEGQVLISKRVDGRDKELFRRGPGHPVGELAILAERPRSASVRAVDGDVRALVIEGESFQSILQERPAVSIALLANLARRLGDMA